MRSNIRRRTPRCSVRTCSRAAAVGAARLETPGPDGAPLSLLRDNGPARTRVCRRHAEGYAVALDIWKRAGRMVIDQRRPLTPEEKEAVRRFTSGARNGRSRETET